MKKEDIGLIEVKDFFSFVAVRKSVVGQALQTIKNGRIKNKKVKIDITLESFALKRSLFIICDC